MVTAGELLKLMDTRSMRISIAAALLLTSVAEADRLTVSVQDSRFQELESESLRQTCYWKDEGDLLAVAAKNDAQNICHVVLDEAAIESARPSKSSFKPEAWTQEPLCSQNPNKTEAFC